MKSILISIVLTLINNTFANSEYGKLVDYVQVTYANEYKKHPILIFNIDDIETLYAKNKAFGSSNEKELLRASIISQYILNKIGLRLTEKEALSFEPYTSNMKNGAYAVPFIRRNAEKEYVMCGVFPASPNSNKRFETDRILGLENKEAYGDIHYGNIKSKLSYEELTLFSIYHELGHCMDDQYLPKRYMSFGGESAHDVHLAESFAEVMGLFFLKKEGVRKLGSTRALYRNLYSMKFSKYLMNLPGIALGGPAADKMGIVYNLSSSVIAAQAFIDRKGSVILDADFEQMVELGVNIVEKSALSSRSFSAVANWVRDGDEALQRYRDYAYSSPDLFTEAFKDLLAYVELGAYMVTKIISSDDLTVAQVETELNIDLNAACDAYRSGDEADVMSILNDGRKQLQSYPEYAYLEKSKKFTELLNNYFINLAATCEP